MLIKDLRPPSPFLVLNTLCGGPGYTSVHIALAVHCTKNEVFQETADLVTFAEEILNGKLHFLCSG